ncbi:MAG TPA: alcohol dehydrogenase catalytic domain-containing protein [Actinomycetota bacterium]|nr:alcohol dehydrogenase catalytic domain-containing protein [Actinomycetota bacterium]
MKALAIDGYGMEHVAYRDVAEPDVGPGEVVVRVRAAAANHLDLWTVSGSLKIEHHFPHVLGADGAGEIEAVGDGVRGLRPGTRVVINPALSCGACEFCRAGEQSMCTSFRMLGEHVAGTFAERIAVPAGNLYPIPAHLSFAEAAALATTTVTAYRMLFTRGRMRPGEWVLITGVGGGLAQSLFQLANCVGGRIFVTSSSDEKIARAIADGADAGINYTRDDIGRKVRSFTGKRGVDLVVDSAGGEAFEAALRALRKGGRVVIAGATAGATASVDLRRVFWNQLEIIGSTMGSAADFADMLRMVAGAELRPVIDRTFPLAEGVAALEYLASGRQTGKVILEIG